MKGETEKERGAEKDRVGPFGAQYNMSRLGEGIRDVFFYIQSRRERERDTDGSPDKRRLDGIA